jgi:hypothetical protein
MRGGEGKEGSLNKERGDCVGDGSLQSHSGANLHAKTAKDRGNVPKGGEADGVALTESPVFFNKKKDGSLCLVQDYHMLNAMTVKNCYNKALGHKYLSPNTSHSL